MSLFDGLFDIAQEAVSEAGEAAANTFVGQLADEVTKGLAQALVDVSTLWIHVPPPSVTSGAGGQTAQFLSASTGFYTGLFALVGVLLGAARMMWEQRMQPGKDLARSLFTFILINGAGAAYVATLLLASSAWSTWIIDQAVGDVDFGEALQKMFAIGAAAGQPAAAPIVIVILGLMGFFSAVIQMMLMFARNGLLPLLTGLWPLSAAATNTEIGKRSFDRVTGWLHAFILYQPVAATVMAAAIVLTGSSSPAGGGSDSGIKEFVSGLTLMILALVALPALMKVCVPAVSAVASGSGAGGGLMAALPSGAMMAAGMRGGGAAAGAGAGGAAAAGAGPAGAALAGAGAGVSAAKGAAAQATGEDPGGGSSPGGGGSGPTGGGTGGGGGGPAPAPPGAGAGAGGGMAAAAPVVAAAAGGAAASAGGRTGAPDSGARPAATNGTGGRPYSRPGGSGGPAAGPSGAGAGVRPSGVPAAAPPQSGSPYSRPGRGGPSGATAERSK